MNKTYRVVFNAAIGAWIAVPETARVRGKAARARKALLGTLLATGIAASAGVSVADVPEIEPPDSRRDASVRNSLSQDITVSSDAAGKASMLPGMSCAPLADEQGQPIAGSCDGDFAGTNEPPRNVVIAGLVAAGAGLIVAGMGGGGDGASPAPVPDPDPMPVPDPVPDPMPGPDRGTVTYANGVTVDKASRTLTIKDASYVYEPYGAGFRLTPLAGGQVTYVDRWTVDTKANTVAIRGHDGDDLFWIFDGAGIFTRATPATMVVNGDVTTVIVDTPAAANVPHTAAVIVDGNKTTTEIKADTTATNGGTGVKIHGDHATIENAAQIGVSGQGSTGIQMTGDGATVINRGNAVIADGGTGTGIYGDHAVVNDHGKTDVSGQGSTGTRIVGNDAAVTLTGTLNVNGGAHGIDVSGDRATLNTSAIINVADAGSVGISIAARNAAPGDFTRVTNIGDINVRLNGTGMMVSGDQGHVLLDGNVNVLAARDKSGVLLLGDGVIVNGNHNAVQIKGKVSVANEAMGHDEAIASSGAIRGVFVSGQGNAVDVSGGIELTSSGNIKLNNGSTLVGLEVESAGNTVRLDGGIRLSLEEPDGGHTLLGVLARGDSTVSIRGVSSIESRGGWLQSTRLARALDGARVQLEEDSVFNVAFTDEPVGAAQLRGTLQAEGDKSFVGNAGLIDASASRILGVLMQATNGGTVENSGRIRAQLEAASEGAFQMASDAGSQAINRGSLLIQSSGLITSEGGVNIYPLRWDSAAYAQLASGGGVAINTADGVIGLHGPGLFGTSASANGTAINRGTIHLNGFIPDVDASGNLTGSTAYTTSIPHYRGAGMVAGSTDAGFGDNAQATSTGVINVINSGFGMLALNGGTATNAGTINLRADGTTVPDGTDHQLVGLGALYGGTAINAESGVINIDTNIGRAFYADAGSRIVNQGRINVGAGITPAADVGNVSNEAPAPLRKAVRQYTVGTNANGTAGTMRVNHADLVDVKVDTGFTAGTSARVVTFDGVFQGQDIAGAQSVRSASAVWKASASQGAGGNINVTMTKNAYEDVVTDHALKQAAAALETGYTSNAMFRSLNLGTVDEVTNGIRQLTGQGFGMAMKQAQVMSHRFGVLADNVREGPGGLGFNLVTRGSPGSRLAGSEYDMAVLASRFDVLGGGKLAVRYGVANLLNLDRNSRATTRNGLSGVSQFAGMQYGKPLGAGFELMGDLQFEQHRLESTRALNYGNVRETATSRNGQDKYLASVQAGKSMALPNGFSFTPSLGLEMRRTRDHAVAEHGAGLYNLNVTGATATAVDAVAGMKLGFANERGLTGSLSVQGGPNLGYARGNRYASLAGAPDAQFLVPETYGRSRFNYKGRLSVGYAAALSSVMLDGYMADQDRVRDYGVMLNVSRHF